MFLPTEERNWRIYLDKYKTVWTSVPMNISRPRGTKEHKRLFSSINWVTYLNLHSLVQNRETYANLRSSAKTDEYIRTYVTRSKIEEHIWTYVPQPTEEHIRTYVPRPKPMNIFDLTFLGLKSRNIYKLTFLSQPRNTSELMFLGQNRWTYSTLRSSA
jgi:hypothetical protein